MRKRNLVFPLVVGSLFMPSIEALERTNDLNSLENENNIYEAVDILIAEGGGGGKKTQQQLKKKEENKKANQQRARERNAAKEEEKKQSAQDAELKEKIAISKLDTDAGIGLDDMKDETKELTAKIAIASISNISAKVVKLKDEFRNYNPTSHDDFLKKADEIKSKINALEVLQDKIDNFLNFNIDNVVNMLSLFDQFGDGSLDEPVFTSAEVIEKSNEFGVKYSSLVEELKAAGIYDDELRQTPGTIESYLFSMRQQTQQYFKTLILLRFF